jgi:hypothetical protein
MALFEFGVLCIALIVVIIVIFLVFFLLLKFVVEFFPSVVIAGLVYWYTGGDLILTIVAFIASAIILAIIGHLRRR